MSIFKDASKLKLRFTTSKGELSTEQLWDLSQKSLESCIRGARAVIKKTEESDLDFLDSATTVDSVDQLKFDILKEVYLTKKKEAEELRSKADARAHNQKILGLIQQKKEGELQNKSVEELEALIMPV